jgi:hypothetical protein
LRGWFDPTCFPLRGWFGPNLFSLEGMTWHKLLFLEWLIWLCFKVIATFYYGEYFSC